MKRLHRSDLFSWSVFNERLDIDFNAFLWVRPEGNVLIDPLPLSRVATLADRKVAQRAELGGVSWIVVTNSAHARASDALRARFAAKVAGPVAEKGAFPLACDRWLDEGETLVSGLRAFALEGSKTPGELALWLDPDTLIFGDLVRCHRAGTLSLLGPAQGVKDSGLARASLARLADLKAEALLLGDGFCVFRDGRRALTELLAQ